jgi:uncharacterized 2Fe-2S/4Fe-4S cluster protein (DUF4445 family)
VGHRIRIENTGEGTSILQALQVQGEYILAPCGGNGTCGKCRVRFVQDPPAPSQADRKVLTEAEISEGVRLACRTAAVQGAVIEIEAGVEKQMDVASGFALNGALGAGPGKKTPEQGESGQTHRNPAAEQKIPANSEGKIAAAVDIGTTTIAMSAVDTGSGRILGTSTGINHQRSWGADVISRMEASNQGKGGLLQKSIRADLDLLREELGLAQDTRMVISGNSTMEHLLQGLSCETLGVAPYTPVDISLHEYENMTILPGISTFVGADIVSGIVACGIDQSEEICILVDLGTNGEMAIGNRDRIISASTAAGPAFEGGNISCGVAGIPGAVSSVEITDGEAQVETIGGLPPVGLCGTGVLETVYELLKEELVDETGLLDDDYFDDGFPVAEGIVFTNKDVREIQLAKSAVRAGLEVLLEEYGTDYDQIGTLYIAGGFGQKINLEKAVGIGLLPEELLDRMVPVGNSSLAGAVMAACDPFVLERMRAVGENAEETSLAENPLFSDLYMDNMFFPEQD